MHTKIRERHTLENKWQKINHVLKQEGKLKCKTRNKMDNKNNNKSKKKKKKRE